jgi:adenine phosphoribosyltransferase
MSLMTLESLKALVRDVPDFPKPGIVFKDITPLLAEPAGLASTIALLGERARAWKPDAVVAIESRGFIFGAALAHALGVGFVPVRKPGKLPFKTQRREYALEYGTDALEVHVDALSAGRSAIIVDDLLATGGTAAAAAHLVEQQGARVAGCLFVIELGFLGGRQKLARFPVDALISY